MRNFTVGKRLLFVITSLFFLTHTLAQNAIVTENLLPGNPISEWGVNSSADFRNVNLNGYATNISVNKGSTVHFKIDNRVVGDSYTLKIYRLGYYNGMGASLKADLGTFTTAPQPAGVSDPTTGLLDCSNWTETTTWAVPANAVSGFYVVKIQSTTTGNINNIVFIVRDDASNSKILLQANDATWQAYNGYGGNNLYNGTTTFPNGHAVKVSYNRPFFIYNAGFLTDGRGSDWYMNDSYPMIRWLERNGYDVSYITNVDVAQTASLLLSHKIFVTAGHDEYCSKEQRVNMEAARAAGVNCAFFTANEVYWKTRWENDVNGNPNRVLVCYKEGTLADGSFGAGAEATCGTKCDPMPTVWTGLWRMGSAYDAPLPENALTGEISWDQPDPSLGYGVPIQVPAAFSGLRFWRNTSIASLTAGQVAGLSNNSLGYEFDYEQFPTTYPHGRILMSSTTLNGHTHKLSLYRNGGTGGPLIFGAGTVQWMWGLDDQHFGLVTPVNKDMQQATVNLFADMGVLPGTLQSGLTPATQSTDLTPPVSVITSPADGATLPISSTITITGTASDAAGVVAGVEVSIDGGVTWQLATGTTNWTFSTTFLNPGINVIKSRAYDDSGNMEDGTVSSGTNVVTIDLTAAVCPCHIFTTQIPVSGTNNDDGPSQNTLGGQEVGLKFQSSSAGFITGIRFYKTAGNTGTHIGELYTDGGTRLAQATFTSETATGWQTVSFSAPVAVTANTTYVAAYFSSLGNYVEDNNYFSNGKSVVNSPLIALADGVDGGNAPYKYTAAPVFPDQNFQAANYWVDVTFTYTSAPTSSAGNNQTIALPTSSVTLDGSGSTGTITDYLWSQVSGPTVPTPVITSPTAVSTTVTGLIQGVYVFQLAVNGGSSTSQVTITVNPPPPPVANAGPNQQINLPTASVTLDGSGSTGIINDYTWTQLSTGPNIATIGTPTAVSTTVSGLIQGVYTFQLSINSGISTSQVTVTVLAAGEGLTIFTTQTPPVPVTSNDNTGIGIELGVKFQSSVAGTVTGVRFYQTPGNIGTHIGELYSSGGSRLAQNTFTGETGSGWQTVTFTTPVPILPNTTYMAAYFSSLGNYTGTAGFFATPLINSPLTALADGTDGPNGEYQYTTLPVFPSSASTGGAPNYWVDVIFSEGSTNLPVQYLNFTATKQGDNVKLQWATNQEENNKGFEVQRSTDGSSWAVLGFVDGAGNSQTPKYYQWLDQNLAGGTYYYRLRQVDNDGHSQISKVLQVSFDEDLSLQLMQNRPNPFNSSTSIDIIIPKAGIVQLMLYDQTGRPVQQLLNEYKTPGKYTIQVNRNGLSSGVYYYNLTALGQSIMRKLTILY